MFQDQLSSRDIPNSPDFDSGIRCLVIVAGLLGIPSDEAPLRHELRGSESDQNFLALAAKRLGMSVKRIKQSPERWAQAPLPALAIDSNGHCSVVARYIGGAAPKLLVYRPGHPPQLESLDTFHLNWSGELLYLRAAAPTPRERSTFDFTWFIPAVIKYRRLLAEVLLMSLVIQIIGLTTPIFFQVIMDKVLVNHAIQTLDVISIGLLCAILFEVALSATRSYVFAHTTSKLDVELGTSLFRHLLALPINYFQFRRVGDSVSRIRELEQIRSFLTGNAITVVLDLSFSFVFLVVMYWYSPTLTLIAAAFLPAYVVVSLVFTPVLRARLNEKFNRSSENNSFLVETISGMETVKSMSVEPFWIHRWERQLAAYVTSGLRAVTTALLAASAVQLMTRVSTLVLIWAGSWQVMNGKLTIGELIAFNMLAGQVSAPILRLAQLWNDFQQIGISMQRLGDILNAKTEGATSSSSLPRIEGRIEFDQVTFRYRPDAPEILRNISFQVSPGETIGIVGRSGSGKSTITKLIQRLYVPDRGRIRIDGFDLSAIDAASLRDQIGVVLQESTLFNRSIRDNIALSDPLASMEAVIHAAKLAGAHDFICELPAGYDTPVGENGSSLSGGQRQRVALARALLKDPRILILDEATSALDYESEHVIQKNMDQIRQGRTVLIVAHRLSAVRDADRIFVIDHGEIIESGQQEELLRKANGTFAHLYRIQSPSTASISKIGT